MRLKHLTLQGFKTFAPRTDVVLGEGITAIVGPNGSGKSNVADSIRWVLGEQTFSQLRAKRTEDLIFAGSSNRQPLGMAEVSITIDNTDHLLPLDFAEVTITRRAYRSGENEYYINKSRVRLRDVLDIASVLGQAYTVVGQGLIDAALSLRPEERRELFEEAAAIRGYFVQREDALRRLNRTEENTTRIHDLVSELEPQVKRMERQARQAQEYGKVEAELHSVMQEWYGVRWLLGVSDLEQAQSLESAAREQVDVRKIAVAAKVAQLAEARKAVWELVDTVSALHEQRAQIQARHASQSQLQAVLSERLSSARSQKQQLHAEYATLQAARAQTAEQLQAADIDLQARAAEIAGLENLGREVVGKLASWDAQLAELRKRQSGETSRLENARRRLDTLQARAGQARRTVAEHESAAADAETALAGLSQKHSAEEAALNEQHTLFLAAQQAVASAESEQNAAQLALTKARASQTAAEAARRDLQRRADGLNSQIASLAGEQQANLFGGVRAVVSAAREGKLSGFVGTVAELLQVPPEFEVAIEAALGGRLQDVVVSSWSDSERAIAMLKQSGAGRATFLPLDTLRATPAQNPPRGQGIRGLARDLVQYEPSLNTLAESLLGRLLIVDDLPAARAVVRSLPANAPWTLATLDGEVVRPGGSVTGGSNTRADDNRARGRTILARERRRRELVQELEGLRNELASADRALEKLLEAVRENDAHLSRQAAISEEARRNQIAAQMDHVAQQSVVARLQQELSWRTGMLTETRRNAEAQSSLLEQLAGETASVQAEIEPLSETIASVEAELQRVLTERESVAGAAGESQMRLAVLAEALRNVRSRREDLRREAARHEGRESDLSSRAEAVTREEEAILRQIEERTSQVAELAEQLAAIEGQVGPSEHRVRTLEAEVSRIEAENTALQATLLESETELSHVAVEKQRCLGALDSLRIEIGEELGGETSALRAEVAAVALAENVGLIRDSGWQVLWPAGLQQTLPGIDQPHAEDTNGNGAANALQNDMPALERRVYALKARLSRLGPVNPLATEEYNSLQERYSYLQTQLADLTGAADALRQIIAELDRTMRDQFAATFEQVNEKFQYFFNLLFSGGAARLELTNPQDAGQSGIEISAQPPGKRMQPLAALSGGERALTSAALLFALLKVRPVPFCVLDEVDAALDESNVTRVRAALQELGEKTQFVVITHNRGTIEVANTIYGVSMAGDGTSQLLSLKVD